MKDLDTEWGAFSECLYYPIFTQRNNRLGERLWNYLIYLRKMIKKENKK